MKQVAQHHCKAVVAVACGCTLPTPQNIIQDLRINKALIIIFLGAWNTPLLYIKKGKVNKITPIVAILKCSIWNAAFQKYSLLDFCLHVNYSSTFLVSAGQSKNW